MPGSFQETVLFPRVKAAMADDVADRFPAITAAKTAKQALMVGLGFGLAQDAVAVLRGNRPGYVDFILRGGKRKEKEESIM